MSTVAVAIRVFGVAAAALAWRVARLRPQHRPVAAYLAAAACADLARWALHPLFAAPGPYAGALRAAFHLDEALYLVSPVGLACAAVAVMGGWRVGNVIGASVLAWVVAVVEYPVLRGAVLVRWGYPGAEAASVLVTAAAAVAWWRRGRQWPGLSEIVVVTYAAAALSIVVAGPYAQADPVAAWWCGYAALLARNVVSVAVHGAWLRAVQVEPAR